MHSVGIVQWNSTRRDHPGNPGGVSGSGPVMSCVHPWPTFELMFDVILHMTHGTS